MKARTKNILIGIALFLLMLLGARLETENVREMQEIASENKE